MTKMKGGLLLNDTHKSKTIEEAIEFFKTNSTFSILTNSSISCITFKATLKDGIESPFIQIRSGIIEQLVTTLLFKYFTINSGNIYERYFYTYLNRGIHYKEIELLSAAEIKKEFDIQLQVYQTTYNTLSSAYEPVCPYPIHCFTDLNKEKTIQEIINRLDASKKDLDQLFIITDTLGGDISDQAFDDYNRNHASNKIVRNTFYEDIRKIITTLGCIVMEFMDDYNTLLNNMIELSSIILIKNPTEKNKAIIDKFGQSAFDEYKKSINALEAFKALELLVKKQKEKLKSLAAYELVRLKQIGFIHGDLHDGNIMYNPNYKYITNDDKEVKFKGRALIIDFGRSLIDKTELAAAEEKFYADGEKIKMIDIYETRWNTGWPIKFFDPYTFEEIYRRRLEVTLAFRKTMIEGLETMLDEFNKLTTEEEKTKYIQDKKIQLKLGLLTNSKYPTNFIKPNEGDFEKEEFDTPFKDVQFPIFEKSNKIIQTLTQKRDEIIPKVNKALIELKKPLEPEKSLKPVLKVVSVPEPVQEVVSNPVKPLGPDPVGSAPKLVTEVVSNPVKPELGSGDKSIKTLETEAKKALSKLTHLTNKFTILFSPTQSVHGGGRYINSHKTQNAFSNRLDGRIRTTLRIKRRQTKRRKRGKRSKKGKRKKQTKRKKINN